MFQKRFADLANNAPGSAEWWIEMKEVMKKTGEVLRYQKRLREAWVRDHMWYLIKKRNHLHYKKNQVLLTTYHLSLHTWTKTKKVKHSSHKDKCGWLENQDEMAEITTPCNDMWTVYQITKNHWQFQGSKWTDKSKTWLTAVKW